MHPIKTFRPCAKLAGAAAAILLLHAASSPAAARPLHRLKNAAVGCFRQSDGKAMAWLPRGSQGRAEEAAAIADGRCFRLHPGSYRVEHWDDGYACLQSPKQACLWVPEQSLDGTIMDDSAF
jgi:hypothetical protein